MQQPCSEELPCGEWIKAERSRFRPLRNDYNIARTAFRQMQQETDGALRQPLEEKCRESWENLSRQLIELSQQETHDLELLAWLCEAQFFAPRPWECVERALELLSAWLELFWWNLYPGAPQQQQDSGSAGNGASDTGDQADGEDRKADAGSSENWQDFPAEQLKQRVAPLQMLAGESEESGLLVMPMRLAPLLSGLNLADFLIAEQQGQLPALLEEWKPQMQSQQKVLKQNVESMWHIDQLLESMDQMLEQRAKGIWRINSFNLLRRAINKALSYLETLAKPAGVWPEKPKDEPEVAPVVNDIKQNSIVDAASDDTAATDEAQISSIQAVPLATGLPAGDAITGRNQAYAQLRQLAEYFRQAEPHSPVTLLLERALYWGRLPLPLLMQELVGNHAGALNRICDLTGMKLDEELELMPEPQVTTRVQPPVTPPVSSMTAATSPEVAVSSVPTTSGDSAERSPPQVTATDSNSSPSPAKPADSADDGMFQQLI
ncbi:type VI secretion system protein TssA [Endozoicomonadaceae bacterium StTr2]